MSWYDSETEYIEGTKIESCLGCKYIVPVEWMIFDEGVYICKACQGKGYKKTRLTPESEPVWSFGIGVQRP